MSEHNIIISTVKYTFQVKNQADIKKPAKIFLLKPLTVFAHTFVTVIFRKKVEDVIFRIVSQKKHLPEKIEFALFSFEKKRKLLLGKC